MNLRTEVEAGIRSALALIAARYEDNEDPDNDLPFHSSEHTAGVVRRAEALLRAMGACEREVQLGRLAAAFHDTVQCWEATLTPDGRVMRRRFTTRNEADSAAGGVQWMREAGEGVFRGQECELLTEAILATVPGWDEGGGTVFQPNLRPDSPPVVRAVALADLGSVGVDGAADVPTGDRLFREENMDIARALRGCRARSEVDPARMDSYRERMLAWCRGQIGYARGRRARLPLELGNLRGPPRDAVGALFSRFDEWIEVAEEACRARELLPPWEVARVMGYPVPG